MRHRLLVLSIAFVLTSGLTACSKTAGPAGSAASPPSATSSTAATSSAASSPTAEAMRNSNPDAASLLTIADVERTTGTTGVRLVKQGSTPEATGRLNFATSDGTLVAIMALGDAVAFDQSMQGTFFSRVTTGTGDMCFVGPSAKVSPTLTLFAAVKGDHAVIMRTFLKAKDTTATWVPIDQLQSLVGLALRRWGN
jgi:hypothetical protein